jgi:predicted RNase H-like HicB family nuclease
MIIAAQILTTKIYKKDQIMMPLKYRIIIEKDPEEGVYIASVPTLPGCNTFGKNAKEAALMAEEAIEVYIETLLDLGKRVPIEDA